MARPNCPQSSDKGRYVYETLWAKAQSTQRPLIDWLKAQGVEYRSYYIVNLIWVKGDRNTALALAARSDVARIDGNPQIRVLPDEPLMSVGPGLPDHANGVESSLTYVHAPDVWALGFTGQGVVVGGQDTGIQWDHPALINHYRGWNGTTANHDYNWHDAIHVTGSSCGADSPAPCDDTDHGTHTMGTVLGDDGGSNQIGMAPGAKFIGCRNMNSGVGSSATYIECFEFFLAPYPVTGTPAQGNPDLAPDVTNNSWGCPASEGCSANSLLAAVQAQRAAGIMTVASAGNDYHSSCSTVGDPIGIYDEVYTVGALSTGTDSLASFSSVGSVTVDGSGRRKPDITAPGTNIRSSVPGSTYSSAFSGTSMASPHVAGAVALLWSARPQLKNNVDLTEQVLDNAAYHINNSTCDPAGTTWPNNYYGYGRLDVKAAVDAVPTGDSYLIGAVTDATTAAPIGGATVSAFATVTQTASTTTITTGQYSLLLAANMYTVTASAYGYQSAQLGGVTVVSGTTTTLPISLTPAATYVVSGLVQDAQTGLPLGGSITIGGYPGGEVSINPASGFYSVTLAAGGVYTFNVSSAGYTASVRTIGPVTDDQTEDFTLNVDLMACTAPGYTYYGLSQAFDAISVPAGWAVINNVGSVGWTFNDVGARGNLTGGTGNFAIADSDQAGSGVSMDTELRSPVVDLSTLDVVTLTFKTDFRYYSSGQAEVADVDVSVNGAAGPWTNVWRKTASYRGPVTEAVDISAIAAGHDNVMLRFHYYNAVWEYWWEVDDVQLGQCVRQGSAPIVTPAPSQAGDPGVELTYALTVSNTDTVSHTFDVAPLNASWPTTVTTPIGPVSAHSSASLTVTVAVPETAPGGVTQATHLLISAADNAALAAVTTITSTANIMRGLALSADSVAQIGITGESVTYTLHLANTGNISDTYDLSASNNAWMATIAPTSTVVAAWSSGDVYVVVSVPLTATNAATDTVHIIANGTGVSDQQDLITTADVLHYRLYLPLLAKD